MSSFITGFAPGFGGRSPVLASVLARIYYATHVPHLATPETAGPWRPPQWGKAPLFTMAARNQATGLLTVYYFDAVIRAEHEQSAVVTLNPVQTGADIADHAYVIPPRLVIEIRQSDSMASYSMGQWADGPSKSVSAYQTLVNLQAKRQPLEIATRLRQYDQMIITDIRAVEDERTRHTLNALVTFTGVLTASVSLAATSSTISFVNSDRAQITDRTVVGQTQTMPVPTSIQTQNNIGSQNPVPGAAVAGAGQWSSSNVAGISQVIR